MMLPPPSDLRGAAGPHYRWINCLYVSLVKESYLYLQTQPGCLYVHAVLPMSVQIPMKVFVFSFFFFKRMCLCLMNPHTLISVFTQAEGLLDYRGSDAGRNQNTQSWY